MEARAQQYRQAPTAASALRLSIDVCNWGGGGRVLGNLHKRHRNSLGSRMDRWMQAALATDTDEAAIASAYSTREAGGLLAHAYVLPALRLCARARIDFRWYASV